MLERGDSRLLCEGIGVQDGTRKPNEETASHQLLLRETPPTLKGQKISHSWSTLSIQPDFCRLIPSAAVELDGTADWNSPRMERLLPWSWKLEGLAKCHTSMKGLYLA